MVGAARDLLAKPPATSMTELRNLIYEVKSALAPWENIVAAYKDVRTGKGHAFCCAHNYSACPNKTDTDQGVTWCTDAKGGKRLHLCVRCGGGHKIEGEGKCSNPHVR